MCAAPFQLDPLRSQKRFTKSYPKSKNKKIYFYFLSTKKHNFKKSKLLTCRILNIKDDSNEPQYRRTELPEFLLDIESSNPKNDHDLPSALINLIRSVKVFGYFDQKIILEMCKYMETKTVYANNYLFKIGELDDSIYVVESGRVNVYITDEVSRFKMPLKIKTQ